MSQYKEEVQSPVSVDGYPRGLEEGCSKSDYIRANPLSRSLAAFPPTSIIALHFYLGPEKRLLWHRNVLS